MQKQSYEALMLKALGITASIDNSIKKINNEKLVNERNISLLEETIDMLSDAKDFILKISAIKKQEIKVLTNIVNAGLKYAYPEEDLMFRIEFEEKRNRIEPEFYLNDLLLKHPFKGDGGGVITIIALLIYLAKAKIEQENILLLDEVLKMVDYEASEKMIMFLSEFSKKYNISILMITHKKFGFDTCQVSNSSNIRFAQVGDAM